MKAVIATAFTVTLALLGCSVPDEGPARLDNYLTRLSRALDTPLPEPASTPVPRINDVGLAPLETPSSSIGVLDFLSLSGCELQVNLGRRNSSLGRNASPSQRLLLDLEFLDLAPACVTYLREKGEDKLADTIDSIALLRRDQLPDRIYNALLAGPELHDFWRLPGELGDYPENTGGDVIEALAFFDKSIARWLAGDFRADNGAVETRLSQLRAGDGGELMLAAETQLRGLGQADAMLAQRVQSRGLCPGGRQTRAADITQTVVTKFFAGDVQPWLAKLNQRGHRLLNPLSSIEQRLAKVLPSSYRRWQTQREALLTTLGNAPKTHVRTIKMAFEPCGTVRWNGGNE